MRWETLNFYSFYAKPKFSSWEAPETSFNQLPSDFIHKRSFQLFQLVLFLSFIDCWVSLALIHSLIVVCTIASGADECFFLFRFCRFMNEKRMKSNDSHDEIVLSTVLKLRNCCYQFMPVLARRGAILIKQLLYNLWAEKSATCGRVRFNSKCFNENSAFIAFNEVQV